VVFDLDIDRAAGSVDLNLVLIALGAVAWVCSDRVTIRAWKYRPCLAIKLPIGIQTLREIREEGHSYVDKTPIAQEGAYTLVASRSGFETLLQPLELEAQAQSQDLNLNDSRIYLGRLAVSVQNCAGEPLPSALIQLNPSPALGPVPFTDQRGQVLLSQLLPGAYTVTVARGSQRSFDSVLIGNQASGSDGQPGSLARLSLTLGSPCPG